ncbi:TIGR04157 family glycosyltransferase [Bacteroides fragilis]|uniref:TIGR04157 family glycosyltransferase n=1 Tax=Bacteroides fragilis TaxID=817 RepID=UPI0024546E60|nr:TIGR04157 family glycosyltransferase [Bacteroides fragilis]WPO60145.1 TIGR04157 family glycosyltransferase [Bacteroides fragilis]
MKELYIINNGSKAAQYGIGTYITQLLSCLSACTSIQVTAIVLDSQENELTEKCTEDIRYLLFPTVRIHPSEKNSKRYARSVAYALLPYIASDADVIFHFNYSYHIWLAEAIKSCVPHCRTILTLHYLPWCFDLAGNMYRFQSILAVKEEKRDEFENQIYEEYLNNRRFYNEVDQVICLCHQSRIFLHEIYGLPVDKTILIHNGLCDDAKVLSEEERIKIKIEQGFKESEKIILFVGRINRLKGVHWLIKAFKKLLKECPEGRLVIVGDGNISEYLGLCDGIWGKVVFTGKQDKHQLYTFYQIADLGVLPSCQEQCSYVGIEMMMHGIPLVGTDAMGISEMIDKEYQVPLNNNIGEMALSTDKLSAFLLKALANKEFLAKQSKSCFKTYYSLDTMRWEMIRLYNGE